MPNNFNKYIKKHKKRSAVIKMVKFLLLYCYRIGNVKAKNSAKILTVVLYHTSAKNAVPHLPVQRMLLIMKKKCEECQCSTCCKVFSSKLSLERHMNVHTEKYECETCHKKFATKYIPVRHRKVHSKEKDFTCHSCNAKFKTKFSQKRHEKNCK